MNHSRLARQRHGRWRATVWATRLFAALLMLSGSIVVGLQTTSAQGSGGSGNSFDYTDNGLDWSIQWDDSIWSQGNAGTSSDLELESQQAFVIFSTLPDVNVSPQECLDTVVPNFEQGATIDNTDDLTNDNGDPVADSTDQYAYQGRTGSYSGLDVTMIHACYDLDGGNSVLWIASLIPNGDAGEVANVADLLDSVQVNGNTVNPGLSDVVGGGSSQPTARPSSRSSSHASASERTSSKPSASERASSRSSASSRASSKPSASERASSRSSASSRASSKPSASERASSRSSASSRASSRPSASSGSSSGTGAGADENKGTYTSPTFGYTLSWNPDDFTVQCDIAQGDDFCTASQAYPRDLLQLDSTDPNGPGTSRLYIEGTDDTSDWSDTDQCVSTLQDELGITGDTTPVQDPDTGNDFQISDANHSAVAFTGELTLDDGSTAPNTVMIDCRQDPKSGTIVGVTNLSGNVDTYFDDVYPTTKDLLDSISFGGANGTPESTPQATSHKVGTLIATLRAA